MTTLKAVSGITVRALYSAVPAAATQRPENQWEEDA